MKNTPVSYSPEIGWIAHVPSGQPEWTKKAISDYVLKVNRDRMMAATGTKRKMIEIALQDLKLNGIKFVANANRGVDLFKATIGTGKIYSHG